jgi:7-keto-8-aminopelargonate synthetase-like enzyme
MTDSPTLQQVNRTYIRQHGRTLSYFGGCDYFRLASHPAVLAAVRDGLRRFGLNVAASRRTTGNHPLYPELEKQLARFFGAEAALLTNSGYVTNLVVAQGLAGQFSHALLDARAHAALQDAAPFLNCPVLTFEHRDAADLSRALQRCGPGARPIVLTDGMFSHDGSVAPLKAYLKLLPADGLLLVDDAHGAGTIGRSGRGTVELAGVSRARVVQTITLSKAFGVYGGAVLGSRSLRGRLAATSHAFIGSTPLPLPLANAAGAALRVLRTDRRLRQRLEQNSSFVKNTLRDAGLALPDAPGPIVALHFADAKHNARMTRALLAANILPPLIQYLGGPAHGYFRFVISSEHTPRQLKNLVQAVKPFLPPARQ